MVKIRDLVQDFPSWKMPLKAITLASLIALMLVACIPGVPVSSVVEQPTIEPVPTGGSTFSGQVLPIFQAKCQGCHNTDKKFGGWDASSYESVMTTGDNGPVVIAGDVQNSLLAQLLQGANGKTMPLSGALPPEEIEAIVDWIAIGANK